MSKQEILKRCFSAGQVGGYKIRVVNTPRILVQVNGKNIWLDSRSGLEQRKDGPSDWFLRNLRQTLTQSEITESFEYIGADRITAERESNTLNLNLSHHGVETYTGVLVANRLTNLIALTDGNNQCPEAIVGLDTQTRIIFNFIGSQACVGKKGYDRVVEGKYATVYLRTTTGEYLAVKKDSCKAAYAPLAHLAAGDVTDEDLVRAMTFSPTEEA